MEQHSTWILLLHNLEISNMLKNCIYLLFYFIFTVKLNHGNGTFHFPWSIHYPLAQCFDGTFNFRFVLFLNFCFYCFMLGLFHLIQKRDDSGPSTSSSTCANLMEWCRLHARRMKFSGLGSNSASSNNSAGITFEISRTKWLTRKGNILM